MTRQPITISDPVDTAAWAAATDAAVTAAADAAHAADAAWAAATDAAHAADAACAHAKLKG